MNRWKAIALGALLVAVLVVGGCASAAEEPAGTTGGSTTAPAELAGTSWDCYEFAVGSTPQTVLAEAPITAEFSADGKMTGSAGVNTYSTAYKVDGTSITIDKNIVTTKMAGSDAAMKQESDYLVTLPTAQSFEMSPKGDLVLLGPAENMIARYSPAK